MLRQQAEAFLREEGDKWWERNHAKSHDDDPVLDCLRRNFSGNNLGSVLEIGCANGWRLSEIKKLFPATSCHGVDPSAHAIKDGSKEIHLWCGTADVLARPGFYQNYNLIICGFCLYLCDREDLFKIVYGIDKALKDNGHLIIYDFCSRDPYARVFSHNQKLRSYKQDYSLFFLAHPAYKMKERRYYNAEGKPNPRDPDDVTVVDLLQKKISGSYPVRD